MSPDRVIKRALVILPALSLAVIATPALAGQARDKAALVNINTAPAKELQTLPGIGPAKAKAILAHRKARPFKRKKDILEVKGIGPGTFAKIEALITVGAAKARPGK